MLERLESTTEGFLVGVGNESKGERLTRVKLYKTGGKVDLSDFMPIMEALGLRVVEEVPTAIAGEGRLHPRLRRVRLPGRGPGAGGGRRARHRHHRGGLARGASRTPWSRLVTLSSLTWWEVQILRALRSLDARVGPLHGEL